jgi:glycosyltransferase involved in cell wall biosynthesis
MIDTIPYDEMPGVHNLADIFVLPSGFVRGWQEQFGMVLVESMASGRAVVSTLSGSIPEVVGDAGVLVQPEDPRALSDSLLEFVKSDQMRQEYGLRARIRAETVFDSRLVARQIGQVYEHLTA